MLHRYARTADGHRSLLRVLHKMLGIQYYFLGVVKLFSDVCSFSGPILLNKLVSCFQETPDVPPPLSSYTYAAILCKCARSANPL